MVYVPGVSARHVWRTVIRLDALSSLGTVFNTTPSILISTCAVPPLSV